MTTKTQRLVGLWLPLLFTMITLVVLAVIGFPGKPSGNGSDLRRLALIDTSEVVTKAGPVSYKGLPDSRDYSKHKDFFAIYLSRYCSGQKSGKDYNPSFCSEIGSGLFDQYNLWRVWGVNLAEPRGARNEIERSIGVTAIKTLPKAIFIWFTITVGALAATICLGFASPFSHWVKIMATAFSWCATVSAIAVASMCQSLFPTLVDRTNNYHPSSTAVLKSYTGKYALAGLWVVTVISTIASILWSLPVRTKSKGHNGAEKRSAPFQMVPKIVRRATGSLLGRNKASEDTSYEKIRVPRSGAHSRGHSRSRSENVSRNTSREDLTSTVLHDCEAMLEDEQRVPQSRYEPLRHRELP